MKTRISVLFVIVLAMVMSCNKFINDPFTGSVELVQSDGQVVTLVLNKAVLSNGEFKSDMWLNADSSGTEYRDTTFSQTLNITTLVTESEYRARVSDGLGTTYLSGYTLGGVPLTHGIVNTLQGIWFSFGIDPDGNIVQSLNNLADTVVVPVEIFGPSGRNYYFNGTGTDYDDLFVPWNAGLSHYYVGVSTYPGVHRYDWYGSNIDSVRIGGTTIYDISGDYIFFQIDGPNQVTRLDSTSGTYSVTWDDTASVDTVSLMISDYLGDRNYNLIHQMGVWSYQTELSIDSLIYLRVEADHVSQVTNVKVHNTELHHLTTLNTNEYWFSFRIMNNVVVQDSANNLIDIGIGA